MSTPFGKHLKLTLDGTSHGDVLSMRLSGFPAGFTVDFDALYAFLQRRAPGSGDVSTSRKEKDVPIFSSGFTGNITNGEDIVAVIQNENADSSAYQNINDTPRPSHADYAAVMKYGKNVDLRGGGHFSGRLTAIYCLAGGICLQYLASRGISVFSHIAAIHGVFDTPFSLDSVSTRERDILKNAAFPTLSAEAGEKMKAEIRHAKEEEDSVGGIIEGAVLGMPVGVGEHLFFGVEAVLSSALFAIPGVKGVEFGNGFSAASLFGSENNDPFVTDGSRIAILGNRAGGILGGMTSGAPIIFRAAVKPTPSIGKEQQTVSLFGMQNVTLKMQGRHDPSIVPRAVPVTEAAVAVALVDLLLEENPQ